MAYDAVVFGAHPDDAEMGMGGTIAKLCGSGRRVLLVSLTRGEAATHGSPELRAQEAAAAAATLGCEQQSLDLADARVVATVEARERLLRLVRAAQPRLVFAPYPGNQLGHHDGAGHVDHLATGALVRDAVKLARMRGVEPQLPAHDVGRLFYYMVPRDRYPHVVVDVSAEFETLMRAIECYASQMAIHRQGRDIRSLLETYRRYHGITAGCAFAEAFLCEEALRADAETLFRL